MDHRTDRDPAVTPLPRVDPSTGGAALLVDGATARAERIEARAMHAFLTGATAAARRQLGVTSTEIGGGTVLAVAHDPTDYWSKTLGLGLTEPVTAEVVREVCRFYELSGVGLATLQIAPAALPDDWSELAAASGLTRVSTWVKLQRHVTAPPPPPLLGPGLRVGPVPEREHPEWARVLMAGFGMPPVFEALAADADPQLCRRFAVWDGEQLAASATVVVSGDTAGLFATTTLPGHRRRGAQSALIAARLQEAVASGATWISAETGTETPEQPNPSLHNLRRAGLVDRYERPNWLWRAR